MTNDEDHFEDFDDDRPLVEVVAENMSIHAGVMDDQRFMAQAEQLLRSFEAIEGRPAADYLEIEEWSLRHLNDTTAAKFLVLPGGKKDR